MRDHDHVDQALGHAPADPGDSGELDDDQEVDPSRIDLSRVPRRVWRDVLSPLPRQTRYWVAKQASDASDRSPALDLAVELDLGEVAAAAARGARRRGATEVSAPLPSPEPLHAVSSDTVQVNIRLRRDDHARLAEAARFVGLRPTTLARALVLNGAAAVLRDAALG